MSHMEIQAEPALVYRQLCSAIRNASKALIERGFLFAILFEPGGVVQPDVRLYDRQDGRDPDISAG